MNDKILRLEKISLNYHTKSGETQAIKDLSFYVTKGEFVSIIGPSGCGKTTILSMIASLIKPSDGKIFLNGKIIEKPDGKLGYMLQKDELFPWRTIEKNVFLPLEITKNKNPEAKKYVLGLLDKYGLKEFKKSYPDNLSGGMRQRVALIRTLATSPDLLLLDEPFSALDYQTRLDVCDDVYRIIKNEKKTAILVTHDISEALSLSDRIIVLTKRPAKVRHVYTPDFDKNLTPLYRREHKDFAIWFNLLWKELKDENDDLHERTP